MFLSFQQLWTVALWLLQAMAKLVTVVGQHLGILPPTAVIRATTWEGGVLAHAKLQNCGLGVNLPVHVWHYCKTFKWWHMYMMRPPLSTAVDCGTPTNPANGQVSHTAGSTFRQTATYSCHTGYNLVGGSTRICQATGVWSGSPPTCQRMFVNTNWETWANTIEVAKPHSLHWQLLYYCSNLQLSVLADLCCTIHLQMSNRFYWVLVSKSSVIKYMHILSCILSQINYSILH